MSEIYLAETKKAQANTEIQIMIPVAHGELARFLPVVSDMKDLCTLLPHHLEKKFLHHLVAIGE